jgi:hypothetical protein
MGTIRSNSHLLYIAVLFLAVGCISWEPGWKQAAAPAVKGDVKALMARAERLERGPCSWKYIPILPGGTMLRGESKFMNIKQIIRSIALTFQGGHHE